MGLRDNPRAVYYSNFGLPRGVWVCGCGCRLRITENAAGLVPVLGPEPSANWAEILPLLRIHRASPRTEADSKPPPASPTSFKWYAMQEPTTTKLTVTMAARTMAVETLKRIKNSVIGNPTAKAALASDDDFLRTSVLSR
jgi:hypothetical protein